jgi:hypothetical protein
MGRPLTKEELDMFSVWYYGTSFDKLCDDRKKALLQTSEKHMKECSEENGDSKPSMS